MITIVSGLPRSGTSLMMQMLHAGGMPLLVDDRRAADDSNPRGYYEYAPVKSLERENSWIGEADGKASVVVAVTDDLTSRFSAVDLVRVASAALGGQGGGGRPDMAQAGGPDASKAGEAIAAVKAAMAG